jgi:zinc protease
MVKPIIAHCVLSNGLTILVVENNQLPEIAFHIWYNVGSKNDTDTKRGIAHTLEHILFKRNNNLSETDTMSSLFKITGTANAFTTKDYTQFCFSIPSNQITEMFRFAYEFMQLPICDPNTFALEKLALMQEAGIAQDNYDQILREQLITAIFHEHPYHHSTRGNKWDIANLTQEDLTNFFQTYYGASNALIIITGDIKQENAFSLAETYLSQLPAGTRTILDTHFDQDTLRSSTILYRDVNGGIIKIAFIVPGLKNLQNISIELILYILVRGKKSRLYQKLVNDLELVEFIEGSQSYLQDPNLLYITCKPRDLSAIDTILSHIQVEIDLLFVQLISQEELARAQNLFIKDNFLRIQNKADYIQFIGETYLATQDLSRINNYFTVPDACDQQALTLNIHNYLQHFSMNTGFILPFDHEAGHWWRVLQESSDQENQLLFDTYKKSKTLSENRFTQTIQINKLPQFICPVPESYVLANGMKVYYYNNRLSCTITLIIALNLDYQYDAPHTAGLHNFIKLLLCQEDQLEQYGTTFHIDGYGIRITMLAHALEKTFELLSKIVMHKVFNQATINRLKHYVQDKITEDNNNPESIAHTIIMHKLFKDQPFNKPDWGTPESVAHITQEELMRVYTDRITPDQVELSIVGALESYNIPQLLEKYFGNWQAHNKNPQPDIIYQPLQAITSETIEHDLDRSLTTLIIAGHSLSETDQDLDKLSIYDQFLTGDYQRNNMSELFRIRDLTGAFYTLEGSLLENGGGNYNMIYMSLQTLRITVSQAATEIINAIQKPSDRFKKNEFEQARKALLFSFIKQFETDENMAKTFLSYGTQLHANLYQERADYLETITYPEVLEVVNKTLTQVPLITVMVGRKK